ncbi:unnamed protein product [Oreochromis niloticus]|nr:unnamed protein product [Mustela putorius furo]
MFAPPALLTIAGFPDISTAGWAAVPPSSRLPAATALPSSPLSAAMAKPGPAQPEPEGLVPPARAAALPPLGRREYCHGPGSGALGSLCCQRRSSVSRRSSCCPRRSSASWRISVSRRSPCCPRKRSGSWRDQCVQHGHHVQRVYVLRGRQVHAHVLHGPHIHVQHGHHVMDRVPCYTVAHRSCTTATGPMAGHLRCSTAATGPMAGHRNYFAAAAGPMATRRSCGVSVCVCVCVCAADFCWPSYRHLQAWWVWPCWRTGHA